MSSTTVTKDKNTNSPQSSNANNVEGNNNVNQLPSDPNLNGTQPNKDEESDKKMNQFPFNQLEKLLTCPICLDRYRQPKLLPCQHTYCLECLENMADYYKRIVKCAECRTENILPYKGVETFPNNLTILSFLELPSVIAVEEAKNGNNNLMLLQQQNALLQSAAALRQKTFGAYATDEANTAAPLSALTANETNLASSSQSASQAPQQYRFAKLEPCAICNENTELVKCLHCDRKICRECKESHMEQLNREVMRLLANTQRNVPKLEETINVIEQKLANMKNNFNFVKNEIKMEIDRCIRELNNRERVLFDEVDNLMESEIRKMTERQSHLSNEKEEIINYCQQTTDRLNQSGIPITDQSVSNTQTVDTRIQTSTDPVVENFSDHDNTDDEGDIKDVTHEIISSNATSNINSTMDPSSTNNTSDQNTVTLTEEDLVALKQQISSYLDHIRDMNVEAVESYKRMKFIADNNMLRSNILTFGELHVRSVVHTGSITSKNSSTNSIANKPSWLRSYSFEDDDATNLDEDNGISKLKSSINTSSIGGSGGTSTGFRSRFLHPGSTLNTTTRPRSSYDTSTSANYDTPSSSISSRNKQDDIFAGYLSNEVPSYTSNHSSNKNWRTGRYEVSSDYKPITTTNYFKDYSNNNSSKYGGTGTDYRSRIRYEYRPTHERPASAYGMYRSKTSLNLRPYDDSTQLPTTTRYDVLSSYKFGNNANSNLVADIKPMSTAKDNSYFPYNGELSNKDQSVARSSPEKTNLNRESPGKRFDKKKKNIYQRSKTDNAPALNALDGRREGNEYAVQPPGDHWWKSWLIDDGEIKTRAEKHMELEKKRTLAEKSRDQLNDDINRFLTNYSARGSRKLYTLDNKSYNRNESPTHKNTTPDGINAASSIEYLQNLPIKMRVELKKQRSQCNSRNNCVAEDDMNDDNFGVYNDTNNHLNSIKNDYSKSTKNIDINDNNNKKNENKVPASKAYSIIDKPLLLAEDSKLITESIKNKFNTLQRFKRRNELLMNLASVAIYSPDGNANESNCKYIPIRERIEKLRSIQYPNLSSSQQTEQRAGNGSPYEMATTLLSSNDLKNENDGSRIEEKVLDNNKNSINNDRKNKHVDNNNNNIKQKGGEYDLNGNSVKAITSTNGSKSNNAHKIDLLNIGTSSQKPPPNNLKMKETPPTDGIQKQSKSNEMYDELFESQIKAYLNKISNLQKDIDKFTEDLDSSLAHDSSFQESLANSDNFLDDSEEANSFVSALSSHQNQSPIFVNELYSEYGGNDNYEITYIDEGNTSALKVAHQPVASFLSVDHNKILKGGKENGGSSLPPKNAANIFHSLLQSPIMIKKGKKGSLPPIPQSLMVRPTQQQTQILPHDLIQPIKQCQNDVLTNGSNPKHIFNTSPNNSIDECAPWFNGGTKIARSSMFENGISAQLIIKVNPSSKINLPKHRINQHKLSFKKPMGMDVSPNGQHIFLADKGNNKIRMLKLQAQPLDKLNANFNVALSPVRSYGNFGSANDQLNKPSDVAVGPHQQLIVADTGNHKIMMLDSKLKYLAHIGGKEKGTAPGKFDHPSGVAFDASGNFYVADKFNRRIQVFTPEGILTGKWGHNNLTAPYRIYVSPQTAIVYVTDIGDHSLKLFDKNGNKIACLDYIPHTLPSALPDIIFNGLNSNMNKVPSSNMVMEKLNYPTSVSRHAFTDGVVLLDSGNYRLIQMTPDARPIQLISLISNENSVQTWQDINCKKSTDSDFTPPYHFDSCISIPLSMTNMVLPKDSLMIENLDADHVNENENYDSFAKTKASNNFFRKDLFAVSDFMNNRIQFF